MVRDLDVDLEVLGVPIVREPDGLAMSSRNAYLSDDERASALALSRALRAGADAAAGGATAVLEAASGILDGASGVEVDYLALVDPTTVEPVPADFRGSALLLVAAGVGTTRLIDNQVVDLAGSEDPQERRP